MLAPLAPSISIYLGGRFKCAQVISTLHLQSTGTPNLYPQKVSHFELKSISWNQISSGLKMNENSFENSFQVILLLTIIALKFSDTSLVTGLLNLFAEDEILLIVKSVIWSVISLVLGQFQWHTTLKNNYIPINGKIILFSYFLLTFITRIAGIMLYFTPSLGLLNVLNHWKMGSLNATTDYQIYDISENGTVTEFHNKWENVTYYLQLTLWDLQSYFQGFLILILLHFVLTFVLKYFAAVNFNSKTFLKSKMFHIFSQIVALPLTKIGMKMSQQWKM